VFTPTTDELADVGNPWARARTTSRLTSTGLALLVLLKCYQRFEVFLCGGRGPGGDPRRQVSAVSRLDPVYGAAQAVLVAEGHRRPDNHEATQRAFVDLWVNRRIDLAPWTFAVAARGTRLADSDGYLGGPGRTLDLTVHPWSSWGGDTCWDVAAVALRGTRQHQLQEQRESARDRKRAQRRREFTAKQKEREAAGRRLLKQPTWWNSTPQLTASEKAALDSKLRPITVLDHLFRLRIRANYEDALMFSQGPETEEAAILWGEPSCSYVGVTLGARAAADPSPRSSVHAQGRRRLAKAPPQRCTRRSFPPQAGHVGLAPTFSLKVELTMNERC
jgi:hypothetical protein